MKLQAITTALLLISLTAGTGSAQLATFDAAQEGNALKQLGNDVKKLANDDTSIAQRITMLAKLDAEILRQEAIMQQVIYQAKYFDQNMKRTWVSAGNQVVANWTTPNYYGGTGGWTNTVNTGNAPVPAWQAAILNMQRGLYIALNPMGAARDMARAASVNTFDGAGPVALQTIGNSRTQQIQIDGAINRLQTAIVDDTPGMNSEVQQLNLLTAAQIIQLRQLQTLSTIDTSLLEQQAIANKMHRDEVADQLNFTDQFLRKAVALSRPPGAVPRNRSRTIGWPRTNAKGLSTDAQHPQHQSATRDRPNPGRNRCQPLLHFAPGARHRGCRGGERRASTQNRTGKQKVLG